MGRRTRVKDPSEEWWLPLASQVKRASCPQACMTGVSPPASSWRSQGWSAQANQPRRSSGPASHQTAPPCALFEEELNKRPKTGRLTVHVAFVPMSRDQLFLALQAGKVDFVTATLNVTPEGQRTTAFSNPLRTGVKEIAVNAPGGQPIATADDRSLGARSVRCGAAAATTRVSSV